MELGNMKIIVSFLTCLFISSAHAELAPDALLNKIVAEVKQEGSQLPLINYVHWETAFQALSSAEWRALDVDSSEKLKNHYLVLYSNPKAFVEKELDKRIQEASAEHRAQIEQQRERIIQSAVADFMAQRRRLAQMNYQVGVERITGNRGSVELITSLNGVESKQDVQFTQVDGQWYLPKMFDFGSVANTTIGAPVLNGGSGVPE